VLRRPPRVDSGEPGETVTANPAMARTTSSGDGHEGVNGDMGGTSEGRSSDGSTTGVGSRAEDDDAGVSANGSHDTSGKKTGPSSSGGSNGRDTHHLVADPGASETTGETSTSAIPPDYDDRRCARVRNLATSAASRERWKEVLIHTEDDAECWTKKTDRAELRVEALFNLGEYTKCIREGTGGKSQRMTKLVDACRARLHGARWGRRGRPMGRVAKGLGVVGALALGCVVPRGAMGAEEGGGATPREARICPATDRAGLVVCFGDRGLGREEQGPVSDRIRVLFDELAREGLRLSAGQRLLVRVDGVRPSLVFHVEPVGEDGEALVGWEKRFAECERDVGCTTEDWHGVVRGAMRQALTELRSAEEAATDPGHRAVEQGASSKPPRYRPKPPGIAGIVMASVGGLGMLTGTGLIIVGASPGNPAPGVRQDRDFLPISRDFYTPGGVTLGVSAAVAAAGIAMVVVDFRRWKERQERTSTSGRRARLWLTASSWGRGVKLEGRF
jgi:hypothetical protein